jgi:glycosyltransferase involved in cell wall biosynthesis
MEVDSGLKSEPTGLVKKVLVSGALFLIPFCLRGMQWLFQRLPLNEAVSYGLKSFFYKRFGFLFEKTISYQVWQNASADVREPSSFSLSVDIPSLDPDEVIHFPQHRRPEVSVVVPLFHRMEILLQCLKSLCNTCTGYAYEVILLDSLPELESRMLQARIKGGRVVSVGPGKSLGEMWNFGADMTRGQYIAFLAGGLLPLPGWLDEMARVFREQIQVGLVGSQINLPEGLIWEAGGAVDEKGSICRLGKGVNPFQPDYSYLREVDFCSAISFLIPKDIFIQVGGISAGFREDLVQAGANLSAAVRMAGRKVLHNPLSKTVILSGPEDNPWMNVQENCRAVQDGCHLKTPLAGRSSSKNFVPTGKILVIDIRTPTPDQDSGSQDIVSYFNIFLSFGFEITFIPGADFQFMEKYTPALQRMGVRCLYAPFVRGIAGHIKSHGQGYDMVLLYKVHCAAHCLDMVRQYCPRARIIFDAVDLHYVREQRQAVIEGSRELLKNAEKTKLQELAVIREADCTIVLSTEEREILLKEPSVYGKKIVVIPLIRKIPGRGNFFSARKDVLFVGGFEHRPNVDAMLYFVMNIWPLIKKSLSEIVFYIIGSKPPREIWDLAGKDVIVTGYLSDISSCFHNCRLSVAPLRYGAGLKGKIVTSLSYGLPCVASSMAVEGSGLEPEVDILVADKPEEFAAAVIRLYQDEVLWNRLSDRGLETMKRRFSFAAGRNKLESLLQELGVLKG